MCIATYDKESIEKAVAATIKQITGGLMGLMISGVAARNKEDEDGDAATARLVNEGGVATSAQSVGDTVVCGGSLGLSQCNGRGEYTSQTGLLE